MSQRCPVQPKGKTRRVILNARDFAEESGDLVSYMTGNPSQPISHCAHPECGLDMTPEAYNAWAHASLCRQIADDEEYLYAEDKPTEKGPWRTKADPVSPNVAFVEDIAERVKHGEFTP